MKDDLAQEIRQTFSLKMETSTGVTPSDILEEVKNLKRTVYRMKKEGVSMWNYKEKIPKMFDVVDGSFEIMEQVIEQLIDLHAKVAKLESNK